MGTLHALAFVTVQVKCSYRHGYVATVFLSTMFCVNTISFQQNCDSQLQLLLSVHYYNWYNRVTLLLQSLLIRSVTNDKSAETACKTVGVTELRLKFDELFYIFGTIINSLSVSGEWRMLLTVRKNRRYVLIVYKHTENIVVFLKKIFNVSIFFFFFYIFQCRFTRIFEQGLFSFITIYIIIL